MARRTTTIEVLERLAAAVGWNPMDALEWLREPLSEGVRLLLLDEMQHMVDRLRNMTRWLQALRSRAPTEAADTGRSAAVDAETVEKEAEALSL